MGLDLTFCPVRFPRMTDCILAYTRLPLDRDYDLFAQINESVEHKTIRPVVEEHQMPPSWRLKVYTDEGLRECTTNPYGSPVTFLYAREIKKLTLQENNSDWNKAVMAFITALEDENPVILWWH